MTSSVRADRKPIEKSLISVVLPLYDEADALQRLFNRVEGVLKDLGCRYEIIFVNDGSEDASARILDELAALNPCVRILHLSRNFGQQAALQAGLSHASGDAVVLMDSDFQDDPAAIPRFVEKWEQGYEVVYGVGTGPENRSIPQFLSDAFCRLLNRVARCPLPTDGCNFGLVDRKAARAIEEFADHDRCSFGLRGWIGFRQIGLPIARGERHDQRQSTAVPRFLRQMKTAVFGFSSLPLAGFYGIALASGFVGFGLFLSVQYHLLRGTAIPGWAMTTMAISFFGALNAWGISMLGEYAVRIYGQVQGRPSFLVSRKVNFDEGNNEAKEGNGSVAVPLTAYGNEYAVSSEPLKETRL